ncbi:MAG: cytochrome C [Sulfurospirillaceae bacterium]|nr:cytochrome C [Sulfurospirillaceae bacterium]
MKKTVLALAISSVFALANNTTITATMSLMYQGLNEVQSGFMHNNEKNILQGIDLLENSNAIFKKVDVSVFIPHNNKIQVTKNINANLQHNLKELKSNIENKKYADATKSYANVMNNCLACHTIVRGW